ncbi:glycosyltransferase family 2 protein [Ruegeria sp.]|uniref:glycosyltransferase family 2 protein n=1 Tax=Ruegeria sp. TaxID=1879320 RepID=UPI003B0012CE
MGDARILRYRLPLNARPRFTICGEPSDLTCAPSECALFEGQNAFIAQRNGESAEIVLQWLAYHIETQGLEAAVILDRAPPGAENGFAAALREGLESHALPCQVVLVQSPVPLGKPDLPPEAHPFCVSESPGKDRMKVPPPSPWDGPLGAFSVYEILRIRFLAQARAVANIDVHDLMVETDISVFDAAVAAEGGLIALFGRHCYPWRVRAGQKAHFGDHICVQFDASGGRQRWCIAPAKSAPDAVWRLVRVGNARPDSTRTMEFYRHMLLRHPTRSISKIVPKTSLIEHEPLLHLSTTTWGHKPVRMPELEVTSKETGRGRCAIVTTMKNEGPFILEWLAYHRAIGFDDFLIYTNDCTDGTDTMLEMLQSKGLVQHRDNPFRQMDMRPQHAALHSADDEQIVRDATWVACIDVDEYVNIKCGDGTLDALFAAVPDANMIAMTWRLFGNGDSHEFEDRSIIEQFQRCAPEYARKPHQAWGFKTLFRNIGLFRKLGVHRPKGLNPQLWEEINWVNGSGAPMPRSMFRNGWRSTINTYGYDLVQLNHYAVRSAESFLVKRDRGRVNHVERDQGLAYWFRMNNNYAEDHSIARMVPAMRVELDRLLSDPEIAAAHAHSVDRHRAKIAELKATPNYAAFYAELTGARLEKLARLHRHFGANVFLKGPSSIPDDVLERDPDKDWFFTVDHDGETQH